MQVGRGKNTRTLRGTATLTNVAQLDVTIPAVDMSRARVNVLGISFGVATATFAEHSVRAHLQSSTVLRFTRQSTNAMASVVSWEIYIDE